MYPASMHIFFSYTVCYLRLQDIKVQSTNQSLVLLDEVCSFFFFLVIPLSYLTFYKHLMA